MHHWVMVFVGSFYVENLNSFFQPGVPLQEKKKFFFFFFFGGGGGGAILSAGFSYSFCWV